MTTRKPTSPAGDGRRRVLIVDDHELVRAGLRQVLEQQPDFTVCGEAVGRADALAAAVRSRPDAVIVDLSLKDSSGLDLIKDLRRLSAQMPVLVLSIHDETLFASRALRAGARGYVMKGDGASKLIEGLRQVLDGKLFIGAAVRDRLVEQALGGGPNGASPIERLTDREMDVFQRIGGGRNTRRIAADLGISVHTVETYRERIKRKLTLRNAAELARYAACWEQERQRGASASATPPAP